MELSANQHSRVEASSMVENAVLLLLTALLLVYLVYALLRPEKF